MKWKLSLVGLFVAIGSIGAWLSYSRAQTITLYQCYQQLNKPWTSVYDRAADAATYGIWGYTGSASQNTLLASLMCPSSDQLGYSVVTSFQKNLRTSMTATQTTVPVTSLALKDGTTLTMSALGNKVFLTIEPGTTREEIVMCTTINTSSINFETCTRGLAFSGTSTSAVAANQKTHNAGSKVVLSNVHYVYEQYVDTNNKTQTIQGDKTATGTWTFTSGTIYYKNSNFGIRSNGTNLQWTLDGWTNSYNFTSSTISTLTASSTRAIGITGNAVHVNASSTLGMGFDAGGSLRQSVSSTSGLAQDSNGIYIVTSTLSTNLLVTTTPTGNYILKASSTGKIDDSWISAGGLNIQSYTAGEAINASAAPLAVYLQTDGKVYKTSDASASTTIFGFIGFVGASQNVASGASVNVQLSGLVSGFSGMVSSSPLFIYGTAGLVSSTVGTVQYKVARAVTASALLIERGIRIVSGAFTITNAGGTTATNTTTVNVGFKAGRITVSAICDNNDGGYYKWVEGYWAAGSTRSVNVVAANPAAVPYTYGQDTTDIADCSKDGTNFIRTRIDAVNNQQVVFVTDSQDGGTNQEGQQVDWFAEE